MSVFAIEQRHRLTGEMPDWCDADNLHGGQCQLAPLAIVAIIGAAISAIGAIQQGQAAQQQADFQADVQVQQAIRERQIAREQEDDFRRNQSRLQARRRAVLGGSGVQSSTGSPLFASEDFAAETELQALRIRAGGRTRASRLEQQATLTAASGRNARTASFFKAGGSLLSAVGRAQ